MPTAPEFGLLQASRLMMADGDVCRKGCHGEDPRSQVNKQCLMERELGGTGREAVIGNQ